MCFLCSFAFATIRAFRNSIHSAIARQRITRLFGSSFSSWCAQLYLTLSQRLQIATRAAYNHSCTHLFNIYIRYIYTPREKRRQPIARRECKSEKAYRSVRQKTPELNVKAEKHSAVQYYYYCYYFFFASRNLLLVLLLCFLRSCKCICTSLCYTKQHSVLYPCTFPVNIPNL